MSMHALCTQCAGCGPDSAAYRTADIALMP
jgi:hypothetical protein